MPDPEITPVETPPVEPVAEVQPAPPQYVTREDFDRLERALYTLAQTQVQSQPAQPVSGSPTDEELWALAQQGNRQAFDIYMERKAEKVAGASVRQTQQDALVNQQLSALYSKYPELSNPQHPLTQRAQAFKAVLVQMGSPANARATDLDAILRAVADSRDLFTVKPVQPSRTPQTGQMPAQHRNEPSQSTPQISAEEIALARKMGIKDPAKATQKFWERNAEGKNSVSPNVAAALGMQNGQPR